MKKIVLSLGLLSMVGTVSPMQQDETGTSTTWLWTGAFVAVGTYALWRQYYAPKQAQQTLPNNSSSSSSKQDTSQVTGQHPRSRSTSPKKVGGSQDDLSAHSRTSSQGSSAQEGDLQQFDTQAAVATAVEEQRRIRSSSQHSQASEGGKDSGRSSQTATPKAGQQKRFPDQIEAFSGVSPHQVHSRTNSKDSGRTSPHTTRALGAEQQEGSKHSSRPGSPPTATNVASSMFQQQQQNSASVGEWRGLKVEE